MPEAVNNECLVKCYECGSVITATWKKGRFSFHNASLLEVLLAVCMYHTTPLRGNSKELEKVKVDFECNRSLPFNDVLKELERQCGVDLNYELGVLNVELI